MKNNPQFDDILNQCLDRVLKGEDIETCLRRYPEQAKELEPLLRTAVAAKIASNIQPRAEFKARARYEFQSALRDMADKKSRRASRFEWHFRWRWQSAWAIAAISVVFIVVAGAGTVFAANGSMPDNVLYPVKRAAEGVQLALTPSDVAKAEVNAKLADRRVEEITYMAAKGDTQEVQILAARLNTNLQNIAGLAGYSASTDAAATGGDTFGAMTVPGASSTSAAANGEKAMTPAAALPAPAVTPAPTTVAPATAAAPTLTMVAPATTAPPSPTMSANNAPAPTIIVTAPPQAAPNTAVGAASPGAARSAKIASNSNAKNSDKSKISQILLKQTAATAEKLSAALNNAPASVRPALRQAISQSLLENSKANQLLEQSETGN